MLLEKGKKFIKLLEGMGFSAYIVGGTPRDVLLGKEAHDVDVATNCPQKILRKKFRTYDIGKSKDFGILNVEFEGEFFEVAQYRSDGKYSDQRRPDSIKPVGSIEQDVFRRDFTINAMFMDWKGNIYDVVNGKADLDRRIIKAVGDPIVRFTEDPLRMLRAARFASIDDFTLEKRTRIAARKLYKLVNVVTAERLRSEIIKAAERGGEEFARYVIYLDELKLLAQLMPEVHAMKYFRQDMRHHPEGPTVFDHTLKALEISGDKPYISKLAILFHDVGKCTSFQEHHGWKLSYHRHERDSAKLSRAIMERLKFNVSNVNAVEFAAANHMKFHDLLKMKDSKIARLVANPHYPVLEDVAWADEFSRGETFRYFGEFEKEVKKAREIQERWESRMTSPRTSIVSGHLIMEVLNLKPGRKIGEIKTIVEDRIIDEKLDPDNKDLVIRLIKEASHD